MFKENVNKKKLIFGLIHLKPMPGTAFYEDGDFQKSIEKAVFDAKALEEGGAHGCLIQTVDGVYPNTDDCDYVRVSCLSVIASEVKKVVSEDFYVGVQIMWNCITPSLAVAKAVGADFTRCTALIGETESPFGPIVANPIKVFEYRNKIDARSVDMIAEISGYHFKGEYNKSSLLGLVAQANMVRANAVEVYHPDETTNNQMTKDIKEAFPNMPIILGGGTKINNVKSRLRYADGALVGKAFEGEKWGSNIDVNIVKEYMKQVHELEKDIENKGGTL